METGSGNNVLKIAVVAANGRSGKEFVTAALDAGLRIKAGVHGTHQFASHPHLEILHCDATDRKQVNELLQGCDIVCSFIGHGKNSPKRVQTEAIKNVIQSSEKLKVTRIISLTGTGVRFSGDKITLIDRFMNLSISIIDPNRVKDGKEHVEELKKSNISWTVLRVLKLTNGSVQDFSLSPTGPTRVFTSRSTVAQAVVQIIKENTYHNQAPIVQ